MANTSNMKSRARSVRREELIKYMQERGRAQYVFDIIEKLEDDNIELDALQIQRLRAAMDARINLLKKYLPDMKSIEVDMNARITSSADDWAE